MIKEAKQKEIRNETAATTMLQLTWGRRSFARPVAQPMCDPIVVTYQAWATFRGQAPTLAPEQITVLCFAITVATAAAPYERPSTWTKEASLPESDPRRDSMRSRSTRH